MARKHQQEEPPSQPPSQNQYSTASDWSNIQSRFNFSDMANIGADTNNATADPLQNMYRCNVSPNTVRNTMQGPREMLPNQDISSRVYMNNFNEQNARMYTAQSSTGVDLPNSLSQMSSASSNRMTNFGQNIPSSNEYPYQ